jgi:hypothetical protein
VLGPPAFPIGFAGLEGAGGLVSGSIFFGFDKSRGFLWPNGIWGAAISLTCLDSSDQA